MSLEVTGEPCLEVEADAEDVGPVHASAELAEQVSCRERESRGGRRGEKRGKRGEEGREEYVIVSVYLCACVCECVCLCVVLAASRCQLEGLKSREWTGGCQQRVSYARCRHLCGNPRA